MNSHESKNPLHNPFYNRFNDPVNRRHDDEQAHAYTLWLKEQNRILPPRELRHGVQDEENNSANAGLFSSRIAAALVLVAVLLLSVGVFLKSL